ncbi:MAG: hypothetical protein IPH41_01935 [Sulfuritalea sp.]|jgi:hypothetical protein|nr:hypothetical protein [Sulfuritalea sp.]
MTGTPPRLPSMLDMFLSAAASAAAAKADVERPPWPANPFKKGVREGSATDKVHAILVAQQRRWFEHCELMHLTGHSRGAITWALKYLGERGKVRSIPSARHPQWRRYRLNGEDHG